MAVTIPQFYGGDLGIDAAVVGLVVLFARVVDVLTDPLVGIASDRSRSRLGQRKPFVLLGIPLFMLAIWMLFVPGHDVSALHFGIWIVAAYLGWTLIELPYDAWGADLTNDYKIRTRLMGTKAGFGQLAAILAVGVPFLATFILGISGNREVLQLTAIVLIAVTAVAFIPALIGLPVTRRALDAVEQPTTVRRALGALMRNGAFLRLGMLWGLTFIGVAMFTTVSLPWMKNVLGLPESSAYGVLLAQSLMMLAGIPLWIFVANRIGKHLAVSLTLAVGGVLSILFFLLIIESADPFWTVLSFGITVGFVAGGFVSVPPAMIPDIADVDDFLVGKRRVGFLYGVMGIIAKLAIGIGVALATATVGLLDFDMAEGASTGAGTGKMITALAVLVPGVTYMAAAVLLWRYPITEKRLAVVHKALQRRDSFTRRIQKAQ